MSKIYLTASYDGQIFEYSKDQKEGYVKHTNTAGKESYRKYYNKGVEGTLMNVDLRVNEKLNNMEEVKVTLKQGEDYYILSYPVASQNGDIDEFTEQLIRVLPKMEKGTVYNIKNWFMKKGDVINGEEVKYNNKGVTVKCADTKIEPALTYKTHNNPDGDIPMLEFKDFKGKKKLSAVSKEAKFEYLYDKLEQQVERLKYVANEQQPPKAETPKNVMPTASPAEAFEPATNVNEEDFQDLPF